MQSVLQLGERLERADARSDGLQRAQKQQARRELCDALTLTLTLNPHPKP